MCGVTDPYQPIERRLGLTRRCLEVLAEFRNPVGMITKNHLIARDADLLGELAAVGAAAANLSITSLDTSLQRVMEPRTSSPSLRLEAVSRLAAAGVPVSVMVAPIIPGLTDHEIPGILKAAAEAGATSAGYVMLRLPYAVSPLFEEWLEAHFPDRKAKVLGRLKGMYGGRLYDSRFGVRGRGEGEYASQIRALFYAASETAGLSRARPQLSTAAWRGSATSARKHTQTPQLSLFGGLVPADGGAEG